MSERVYQVFPAVDNLEFEVFWVLEEETEESSSWCLKSIDGNPVLGLSCRDSLVDWNVTQHDAWVGWRRSKSAIANRALPVY